MNTEYSDQPYDFYEHKRKYPRIHVNLPITLYLDNKQSITASIYDISPDGLQIRCSRSIAAELNPSGKKMSPDNNLIVNTKFTVPIEDKQHVVTVSCQIYYFVMLPDVVGEDIAFGLKFRKFEGQSIRYIGSLIENELEPTVV
jgi:PilZ domain